MCVARAHNGEQDTTGCCCYSRAFSALARSRRALACTIVLIDGIPPARRGMRLSGSKCDELASMRSHSPPGWSVPFGPEQSRDGSHFSILSRRAPHGAPRSFHLERAPSRRRARGCLLTPARLLDSARESQHSNRPSFRSKPWRRYQRELRPKAYHHDTVGSFRRRFRGQAPTVSSGEGGTGTRLLRFRHDPSSCTRTYHAASRVLGMHSSTSTTTLTSPALLWEYNKAHR